MHATLHYTIEFIRDRNTRKSSFKANQCLNRLRSCAHTTTSFCEPYVKAVGVTRGGALLPRLSGQTNQADKGSIIRGPVSVLVRQLRPDRTEMA